MIKYTLEKIETVHKENWLETEENSATFQGPQIK